MAAGNFTSPLVTVANGDIIDATVRNNEFINILANANPTGLSGYQDNLAQKQLQEDPATGLVTSLGKEIEQLRFALKRILGETYWYTAPDTDLAAALFSGKAGDVVLGDGTKTTTDPLLTLNADTGDAGIRLQVNDTSANAWDIYNDNSDGDRLKFDYNGVTQVMVDASPTTPNILSIGNTSDSVRLQAYNIGDGDAGVYLRVNNSPNNEWKIYLDNSDSDKLKFDYNDVTKVVFNQGSDSDVNIFGSGSDGHFLGILSQDTGGSADAGIILRVNNTSANDWMIYNDNSDSDRLKLRAGASQDRYEFKVGGTDTMKFECQNITTSTAPEANTLYPHSMVKAWGRIAGDSTTTPTIVDAFNVNTAVISSDRCTVTFRTAMANNNYAVVMTSNVYLDLFGALVVHSPFIYSKSTTGFVFLIAQQTEVGPTIAKHDIDGSSVWSVDFMVVGRQ
jgi:hypothetical protein